MKPIDHRRSSLVRVPLRAPLRVFVVRVLSTIRRVQIDYDYDDEHDHDFVPLALDTFPFCLDTFRMNEGEEEQKGGEGNQQPGEPFDPTPPEGVFTQQIRHQHVAARVPESVGRGVFSSGVLVQNPQHEFVLDFLVTVTRPHQVVARVVLPPTAVQGTITALQQNLSNYHRRFGSIPPLPKPPPPEKPPSIEEIYAQLKLPEPVLSGTYANGVIITHSPSEFVFDFITNFYPKSAVASRVYMAVHHVPHLLETLKLAYVQFQKRRAQAQERADPDVAAGDRPNPPLGGDADSPEDGLL